MTRIKRSNLLARHAAVLSVSLAALIVPFKVGGSGLSFTDDHPGPPTALTGAVLDCFAGPSLSSCPGPSIHGRSKPALAATASPDPQPQPTPTQATADDQSTSWVEWPSMEVREGDTLYGLAAWFGVSASDIAAINGIDIDSLLGVGQTLYIPVPISAFVIPPEPALFVAADTEAPETPGSAALDSLAALLPVPTPAPATPTPYGGTHDDIIAAICSLPWPCDQMIRVAYCESGLNPNAINGVGFYGLFQINYIFDGWNDPWTNSRVAYEQKYLPALAHGDPYVPWPKCRPS